MLQLSLSSFTASPKSPNERMYSQKVICVINQPPDTGTYWIVTVNMKIRRPKQAFC